MFKHHLPLISRLKSWCFSIFDGLIHGFNMLVWFLLRWQAAVAQLYTIYSRVMRVEADLSENEGYRILGIPPKWQVYGRILFSWAFPWVFRQTSGPRYNVLSFIETEQASGELWGGCVLFVEEAPPSIWQSVQKELGCGHGRAWKGIQQLEKTG